VLDFEVPATGGEIEPRVTWYARSLIRLDGLVVSWLGTGM
jgi:hypothetical protein